MRRLAPLLIVLLTAGSAAPQPPQLTLDGEVRQARAEQEAADEETAKFETAASEAHDEAARLHAQQLAAAQAIQAAEARISASDAQLRLASAYVADHRRRLAEEQRPISSLLAGLATMGERPPLLALADRGGPDELVKVRILLDATLPLIRRRTAALSSQLSQGRRLEQAALAARNEVDRSRKELDARRQQFASLEEQASQRALASSGRALEAGDFAIAAGEDVERLRASEGSMRDAQRLASQFASADAAPSRPVAPEGSPASPPFEYQLPVAARVTEGLGSVNDSGVQSRGLALATSRGMAVTAPAPGIVRYSGPFRDYDGILIIDHGRGWMTLIINVASPLDRGTRIQLGDRVGQALGPIEVELSQNGRRMSPALIAGSSQTLSKGPKGG